jgi:flagellar protein FliO/FliZ
MGTAGAIGVDWLRVSGSFVLVLLLLGGMLWLLRRMKDLQLRHKGPARLELCETIHVGPRQKVALVRVGDKHILVGISPQQLVALGEVQPFTNAEGTRSES